MTDRDFEKSPYTPDEERVARYVVEATGAGGGNDPIGFLIASHRVLAEANRLGKTVSQLYRDWDKEGAEASPSP